jgi:hypothetical protein
MGLWRKYKNKTPLNSRRPKLDQCIPGRACERQCLHWRAGSVLNSQPEGRASSGVRLAARFYEESN